MILVRAISIELGGQNSEFVDHREKASLVWEILMALHLQNRRCHHDIDTEVNVKCYLQNNRSKP